MDTQIPEIHPSIKDKIKSLDPDIASLFHAMMDEIVESESHKTNISNKTDDLQAKLENFRGMIARRDSRIEKLEKKLEAKKK